MRAAHQAVLPKTPAFPRLVFVSRGALPDGAIPGLGPAGRTASAGGALELREPDGRVHPLVPPGRFADVSDPSVSWDGRTIAFAGLLSPLGARASGWRIWTVRADGSQLTQVTRDDRALDPVLLQDASLERYDDFDPCWLPDGAVCFASTRFPQLARPGIPSTNLFVVRPDGSKLRRITAERNGAEEPAVDPRTGRIVFARWWFNRFLASDVDSGGLTLDPARALPADTVDLWHAISITPDGDGPKLAGGDPRTRGSQMAYQPLVLTDGTLIGVSAADRALVRNPGRTSVRAFPGGFAAPVALGPAIASACAPAELPDGRIVFSMDPEGGRRFGLYAIHRDGRGLSRLYSRPGRAALDAAVIAPRRRPPIVHGGSGEDLPLLPPDRPQALGQGDRTFRFDCLNVFANGPVDSAFPDAPPMQPGARIRFFAPLARPGGDTIVLVRESPVVGAGAVHVEDLPADTPMFEQLVDAHGHVLRAVGGPAHVAGMNFARFGSGTQCVGCHTGHSALEVPHSAFDGEWTNASPSAEATASSSAPGTAGARAVRDRRAIGNAATVGWVAEDADRQWVRLQWRWPIEVRAVVLYALSVNSASNTRLDVLESELVLFRGGHEVRRIHVPKTLASRGTRVVCEPVIVDALEVRPLRVTGRVLGRKAAGIAEIETVARLVSP